MEMEALTGASVAALTVYDMTKALSHDIVIRSTRLLTKSGGKSDYERVFGLAEKLGLLREGAVPDHPSDPVAEQNYVFRLYHLNFVAQFVLI